VEAITKAIEPYQKLFTTIVKWQRAEKKWMDGAFLELNAEATEAEVKTVMLYYIISEFSCLQHCCISALSLMKN